MKEFEIGRHFMAKQKMVIKISLKLLWKEVTLYTGREDNIKINFGGIVILFVS